MDANLAEAFAEILDKENAQLRAEIAELRKDRERLGWMIDSYGRARYYDPERMWWIEYDSPNSIYGEVLSGPMVRHDPREAIDAAMAVAETKGGE